ncbi:hypothetical protein PENTCL1PPCAC_10968, partial [Pristionchus entomophagus]
STAVPMLLCALVVLPLALACGPGEGAPTAKPTMKFSYSPPVGWTYSKAAAAGGQSLSRDMAQNRINMDIEFAVLKAVESYGYSTSGVQVKNAVAPEEVEIGPISTCETPKYAVEDGAVTKKCGAVMVSKNALTLNSHASSITVTSPIALYESNWENIGIKVYSYLTSNAGVKFYGLITVRA